jgi:hypothetical protein
MSSYDPEIARIKRRLAAIERDSKAAAKTVSDVKEAMSR